MLGLFRRHPKLPADKRPDLARDERVLAWSAIDDSQVAVATNLGLWLPGAGRLGWHEIHKATWSGRELAVTPADVAEPRDGYAVVADGPVRSYPLVDPGELPHQVRARVTRSVAYTAHHALAAGGAGVRVVARRVPGQDGLTWSVRYDPGVPSDAEAVVARTDELVGRARAAATPDVD
jgi:hypothetical protein